MATAMGDVTVTPGSAVGRLGDAAAAEEAAAAAAAASRDTPPAGDPPPASADPKPADAGDGKPAELTPEQKAEAVTAAEKAVAEAKTPEEKAAAEAKLAELKGEKKDEKTGAPEKYEPFKMPEGVALDEAAAAEFEPIARELNLTQEQAQKLVDLQTKFVQSQADKAVENWNAHLEATTAESKADKEIGGANWDRSLGLAKTAIQKFGTPELQAYLNEAEAGSHKEIIRFFAKVGKAVSEDGFVAGQPKPGDAPKSQAERIYPSMNK